MDNKSSTDSIEVLEWYEAVRARPKMWIGSTGSRGLHQLVWELLYDAVDEAEAGHCSHIALSVNSNGSVTIENDGRGIPTSISEKTGKTGVETAFTTLGCPTGFELAMVNAFCKTLEVEVFREGKAHRQLFHSGVPETALECVGNTEKSGTRITIFPDTEIFHEDENELNPARFDFETLSTRLREMAFLNKGLHIDFTDARNEKQPMQTFKYDTGIADYLEWLNAKHMKVIGPPVYYAAEREHSSGDRGPAFFGNRKVSVECALQWTTDREAELCWDFVNCDPAGGEFSLNHIYGTIAKVFSEHARANLLLLAQDCDIGEAEIRWGLSSIVSLKIETDLRWLEKQDLRSIVNDVTLSCLKLVLADRGCANSIIEALINRRKD